MTSKEFERMAEHRKYVYKERSEALTALAADNSLALWTGKGADGGPIFIVAPGRHAAVEAVVATLLPTFGKASQSTINRWLMDELRKGVSSGD